MRVRTAGRRAAEEDEWVVGIRLEASRKLKAARRNRKEEEKPTPSQMGVLDSSREVDDDAGGDRGSGIWPQLKSRRAGSSNAGPCRSPVSAAPWAGPVHCDSAIVSGAVSGAWAPFLVSKVFLLNCFPWTRPKSIPRDGNGTEFRGKFDVDSLGLVDCLNSAGGWYWATNKHHVRSRMGRGSGEH